MSYLQEKVAAPVKKIENTVIGDPPRWLRDTALPAKVRTNFADKRQWLGIVRSRTQATEIFVFVYGLLSNTAFTPESVACNDMIVSE
jgi:hypothetical protein